MRYSQNDKTRKATAKHRSQLYVVGLKTYYRLHHASMQRLFILTLRQMPAAPH